MKYKLSRSEDVNEAADYLAKLVAEEAVVEIKKVQPGRSLNQNAYLHLLAGAFGLATATDIESSKAIYKWVNKDIYYRKVKIGDEVFLHIRSSATLNKEEMAKSIDKFMLWSAEQGYPLPPATNQEWLMQVQNEIEREGKWL